MKRFQKITALLCAAVLLCSCSDTENPTEPITSDSVSTEAVTDTAPTEDTAEETLSATETTEPVETVEETDTMGLPRMDGSTSAIPLEIGLKSGFLGISYNEAKELVSHTTTHDSFKRLINGEVDLIFSVPISEEQQKMADEAGVTLFMEPVAREGFVFVVNADNPVDSLTSEQLRKIYSGEITNWSEVGGNDEPILPYQRNTDSGSQNYMTAFMGDTPLLPPKTELVAGMMMSLMDAIAVYDNSSGAIGYSVYSYAAQMYANANKVKFISVDGVAPSKATMADESYPLLSCTYIIYTDKSPESAREFAERVLSDEGQGYVLDSGYLPVNGMEVPEKYLPYEAVGTGAPKSADFAPSLEYSDLFINYYNIPITADGYFNLDFLKDEELQSRINEDIRAATDRLRQYDDSAEISIKTKCKNGYLSLILGHLDYSPYDDRPELDTYLITAYRHAETLTYDLIEGKKIEHFSDLFYEGEDFLPDINQSIADWIVQNLLAYSSAVQKQDFSCIMGEPRLFTISGIILEPDNPYFTCAPFLEYYDNKRHSIVSQYRDMNGLFKNEYVSKLREYQYAEWETAYVTENGDTYERVIGSLYHTDEEVKAEDEFWYELQRRAWDTIRRSNPDWHSKYTSIDMGRSENYYYIGLRSVGAGDQPFANFDAETLELITMEMLVGKEWQQYVTDDKYIGLNLIPSEWFNIDGNVSIYAYADTPLLTGFGSYIPTTRFTVPKEKINERYINNLIS